jgi:hypothetical protein
VGALIFLFLILYNGWSIMHDHDQPESITRV